MPNLDDDSYAAMLDNYGSELDTYAGSDDYKSYLRFGVVDNGVILLMTLAGVSLDAVLSKRLGGARGYGPLLGAVAGNALSTTAAGLTVSGKAAAGVAVGSLLPLAPVVLAAVLKKPLTGTTGKVVGGVTAALLAWAILSRKRG